MNNSAFLLGKRQLLIAVVGFVLITLWVIKMDASLQPTISVTSSGWRGQLPYWEEELIVGSPFAGGRDEFSAVTYNHDRNQLLIVEDENWLYKLSVTADLMITNTVPLTMAFDKEDIGHGVFNLDFDLEGIAWMYEDTYAILDEHNGYDNSGRIYIVDLSEEDLVEMNGVATINSTHIVHSITTGINDNSSGAEGIAFDFNSAESANEQEDAIFYLIKEKNTVGITRIDWNGITNTVSAPNLARDLSDIYMSPTGALYLLSHEDRRIMEVGIDAAFSTVEVFSEQYLPDDYVQAEGLTFNEDMSVMVVVSEKDNVAGAIQFGRYVRPVSHLPYTLVEQSTTLISGTNQFAGVTLNETHNRLLIVDDGTRDAANDFVLHEFALDCHGSPTLSRKMMFAPAVDIEGIAWMYDDTYAILSEQTGIYIVDLPDDPSETMITNTDVITQINTSPAIMDTAKGAEGIAFVRGSATSYDNREQARFYVLQENPPAVYEATWTETISPPILTLPSSFSDASGIYAADDGSLFITSDSNQSLLQINLTSPYSTTQPLPTFNKVGGVTFNSDLSTMYVVSELTQGGSSFGRYTNSRLPYVEADLNSTDMGSSLQDFSGITYNRSSKRLLVVDDKNHLIEFEVDENLSPIRVYNKQAIETDTLDIEGVAWMYDDTIALLSEAGSHIYIVDIPDTNNSTMLVTQQITITTLVSGTTATNNRGGQGLAFDYGSDPANPVFYVVDEEGTGDESPAVYRIDGDGNTTGMIELPMIENAAGVYAADDNMLYVISDQSKRIVQLKTNDAFDTATTLSVQTVPFSKASGIVLNPDLTTMLVVGELVGNRNYSFGRYTHTAAVNPACDTISITPTPTPTNTPNPTSTPIITPTNVPTIPPTPTLTNTPNPTSTPIITPTNAPTSLPTHTHTSEPTDAPTLNPTDTSTPSVPTVTATEAVPLTASHTGNRASHQPHPLLLGSFTAAMLGLTLVIGRRYSR